MIRQSFCWWCFQNRGVGDRELLAAARAIGFDAVELLPTSLLSAARDAGLAIATHVGHGTIPSGMNDPANHGHIVGEVKANLDLAAKFGIQNLIVFSGNRRDGLSDDDGRRHTIDVLTQLAPLAEAAKVTLVLELLNSRVDHSQYQCDRTEWGVAVCEQVSSPRVKLLYDVYHMQLMEGDLIRTIRRHHAHIGHYHIAGALNRDDPDEMQEINYPAVIRAIGETGYEGYVGHEYLPRGEPVGALARAYRMVNSTPSPIGRGSQTSLHDR